jgi:hypothetical protein
MLKSVLTRHFGLNDKISTHFFEVVLENASWHLTAPQHLTIFFLLPALARRAAFIAALFNPIDAAEETF